MSGPSCPIILDNRGDISGHPTMADALACTEPVDVDAGEFEVFDSEGRAILLGTAPGGRFGNRRTVVTNVEEPPRHADELRERLLEFLRRCGVEAGPPGEELRSVVARFMAWQSQ